MKKPLIIALHIVLFVVNPFSTNVPLLYPLKTSENRKFSVFRGYRSGTLVENGLTMIGDEERIVIIIEWLHWHFILWSPLIDEKEQIDVDLQFY